MLESNGHESTGAEFDHGDDDAAATATTPGEDDTGGLDSYMSNIEREAITQALRETRFNKTAAAKKLGITFRALRYKLKKLGMD
jgi:two-component system response regulator PilR (NtrC family)